MQRAAEMAGGVMRDSQNGYDPDDGIVAVSLIRPVASCVAI
jgi:hypothetical protein